MSNVLAIGEPESFFNQVLAGALSSEVANSGKGAFAIVLVGDLDALDNHSTPLRVKRFPHCQFFNVCHDIFLTVIILSKELGLPVTVVFSHSIRITNSVGLFKIVEIPSFEVVSLLLFSSDPLLLCDPLPLSLLLRLSSYSLLFF